MSVHAFIDESQRDCEYTMCIALVDPGRLAMARKALLGMRMPDQREPHVKNKQPRRRRVLADRVAALPVQVRIYGTTCTPRAAESARQRLLRTLVKDLRRDYAWRAVFDARQHRDINDRVTINAVLGVYPARTEFTYERVDSVNEPLIWIGRHCWMVLRRRGGT